MPGLGACQAREAYVGGAVLDGLRVLIVEDEEPVARALAEIVREGGGDPVGPARSNAEAERLIEAEALGAALLDLDLPDGEATPTAERLAARGIPILVCTDGVLPRAMRLAWPDLAIQRKPVEAARLVAALAALVAESIP